jgi:PAS domain S-box-containing protein
MSSEPSSLARLLARADIRRLHGVFGGRADAVVMVTAGSGEILWASHAGSSRLFGCVPDDYVGDLVQRYIHPDDLGHVWAYRREALHTGETKSYTFRAVAADGAWVPMRSVTWRVRAPDGSQALVDVSSPAV